MKKICLFVLIVFLLCGCSKKIEMFELEDKYYGEGSIVEIGVSEFEELINNKESFGVFIYQDFCAASDSFEVVLNDYINEYNISFYKLSFGNMNETKLKGKIKFYPSFIVYNDGKMIDYLDADSASDADYYKSVDGFNNWVSTYVLMK